MASYHNIHIGNDDLQDIENMGMTQDMLDAVHNERDTILGLKNGQSIKVSFDGLEDDGTAAEGVPVDVYITNSKSEKRNESITTKDPKFKEALKIVLTGLGYESKNDEYLRKYKNIENPTDDQVAMWQAYGIFNAIESVSDDFINDKFASLAIAVDDYIGENGGWDFIPNDD